MKISEELSKHNNEFNKSRRELVMAGGREKVLKRLALLGIEEIESIGYSTYSYVSTFVVFKTMEDRNLAYSSLGWWEKCVQETQNQIWT